MARSTSETVVTQIVSAETLSERQNPPHWREKHTYMALAKVFIREKTAIQEVFPSTEDQKPL
jgi:hypothetical protein